MSFDIYCIGDRVAYNYLEIMHGHQRSTGYLYNASPYGIPGYGNVAYQVTPLDITWFNTWPKFKSILLSTAIIICSTAVIGLDIANVAIEAGKENGTSKLGSGPGKVGAGIWSGSVSFIAAVFILVIGKSKILIVEQAHHRLLAFSRNKRSAATFALIAVTLAFCFMIVLIGLIGNAIQNNLYVNSTVDADKVQNKLLIAMISISAAIVLLCMIFFAMFISVCFSPATRPSNKR